MDAKVKDLEAELELQDKFSNLMLLYAVQTVIPTWKKLKLELYQRVFASYQIMNLRNAQKKSKFFIDLIRNEKVSIYEDL